MMKAALALAAVALLAWLPRALGECRDTSAEAGLLFSCQLTRADFFPDISAAAPVLFSASLAGSAGLPDWLSLEQRTAVEHGFLYGTPPSISQAEGTIVIEVEALRRDTYERAVSSFNITITAPSQGSVLLISELYLTNFDLPELLSAPVLDSFAAALVTALSSPPAAIVTLISPSSRGVPVPPPPGKLGVIVAATPGMGVASIVMATASQAATIQANCSGNFSLPPASFAQLSDAGFQVDWCRYFVYETEAPGSSSGPAPTVPERPRPPDVGSRSRVSLVVIAVLCAVSLILVLSGLGWLFLGGRRKAFYVSRKKCAHKSVTLEHNRSSAKGPLEAQIRLSNLSQVPSKQPSCGRGQIVGGAQVEEGRGEEFRDLADYNENPADEARAPPPYNDPPRRYRLITL